MVAPAEFKEALSAWASGVAVVVADDAGHLYGLTVSSFTSVSLDPPLVLCCLHEANRLPAMIRASRRFSISVLADDQEAASTWFASPGREPTRGFTGGVPGAWTPDGQAIVADAAAWLACSLLSATEHGDHIVVLGRVEAAHREAGRRPLLYWDRGYRQLGR